MADKKLVFDIGANSSGAQRALAELRKQYDTTIAALKKQQGEIALFKAMQLDAKKLEAQIKSVAKAGGDTAALTAALATQRAALTAQAAALQNSGVNTNALSLEQARLRVQSEQTTRSFRTQSAALTASNGIAAGLRTVRTLAATLLPGVGVAGFAMLIKGSIDSADRLNDLRQITGLTVPELNGLSHAAELSGTDIDGVAKGVGLFAKFVGAAKNPTSEQAKLLGELGISAKTPQSALFDLADIFESMPDGLEKTDLAMRLFGKSGAAMIPLLNGGSAALRKMMEEGQALNPVTDEMGKKADALNDSLGRLKSAAKGVGTVIADAIAPGLTIASDSLGDYAVALQDVLKNGSALDRVKFFSVGYISADVMERLKAAAAAVGDLNKKLDDAAKTSAVARRKDLAQQLVKVQESETSYIKASLDKQEDAYRKAASAIEKTENDRVALAERNAARIEAITAPKAAEADLNAADPLERSFNQSAARFRLIEMQAKATAALATASAPKDFDKVVELGNQAAELIDRLNQAGGDAPSVLAAQQRTFANIQDQALSGKGKLETTQAEAVKTGIDELKKQLEAFKLIPIGIDIQKSQAALIAAHKEMQATLDAHPLVLPVAVAPSKSEISWTSPVPAHADGGLIRGPGSGTSDSILIRASNREFMMRAAATKRIGLARLNYMNATGRIPGFADGGAIGRSVASLPRVEGGSGGSSGKAPINLVIDGKTFAMEASDVVADSVQREFRLQALKYGRRK